MFLLYKSHSSSLTWISILHLAVSIFNTFLTSLCSFGVISVHRKYSLIFNILLMWSPDKEGEEDHDEDLEEDHVEDMTAGLHGLFPSTCHVFSNT